MERSVQALPPRPGVYRIDEADGRCLYVGQSRNLVARRESHLASARSGTHANAALARVLQSGRVAFTVVEALRDDAKLPLARLEEFLLRREAYWMEQLRPGLNIEGPRLPTLDTERITRSLRHRLWTLQSLQTHRREQVRNLETTLATTSRSIEEAETALGFAETEVSRVNRSRTIRRITIAVTLACGLALLPNMIAGPDEGEGVAGFLTRAVIFLLVSLLVVGVGLSEIADPMLRTRAQDLKAKGREELKTLDRTRRAWHGEIADLACDLADAERYGLGTPDERAGLRTGLMTCWGIPPSRHFLDDEAELAGIWFSDVRRQSVRIRQPRDLLDWPSADHPGFQVGLT